MCKLSEDTKQKLGNAIIYIANHTEQLSKTKLLKLLFLMEEYMVKRYHVPFMGLPFEVWQAGPVAKDIIYTKAIKPFCDDEFSDCEIEMMNDIIRKYGKKTAKQLVAEVHSVIDFSEGLSGCAQEAYKESLAIRQTANFLKAQVHL